ncbi:glutaredoxin, partial [Amniculicola lignicola CBS 123094]
PQPNPTATISFLRSLFTRASSPANMSATKTKVQAIIDENPVAVFSKSYCPYCRATKQLLTASGAKFYAIELDQVDDGSAIQSTLASLTGQSTVPNIFINKQHIGGNSDLQAKKGELKNLLQEAGAV